ncbi:MAG: hypothetical protein ACP5I3_08435 [Thermoproteus sp.]
MYVELFVISGKSQELEESLKKAIEEIRSKVERRDRVRLATVKIRQDAADQVVKMLDQPVERVPPHFRSLVSILKRYNITAFPAVVIDGQKILEGTEDVSKALNAVYKKAGEEFGIQLGPQAAPPPPSPPAPPAPTQPVVTPPPQPPPVSEIKPLEEALKQAQQPPPPPQPPQPPSVPSVAQLPPQPVQLPPPPQPQPPAPQPVQPPPQAPPPPVLPPPPRPAALKVSVRIMPGRPDDCRECAYYGEATSRCYLFSVAVSDPARPPCKNVGG